MTEKKDVKALDSMNKVFEEKKAKKDVEIADARRLGKTEMVTAIADKKVEVIVEEAREELSKLTPPKSQKPVEKETIQVDLYAVLSAPIPKEFLVTYTENGKEFTGYHAQYAIDLLNKTVGYTGWNTRETILKDEIFGKAFAVGMTMTIEIIGVGTKTHVTGYGGAYAKDIANAYKGAKTSAFKNACRYLGIGKELYIKGFEDDIRDVEKEETGQEEVVATDSDEETNQLMKMIDASTTHEGLGKILTRINAIPGANTKKLLIKKYNDKKLSV